MRSAEAFKQRLADLMGMENLSDDQLDIVTGVADDLVGDYEEAMGFLGQAGKFSEDGTYELSPQGEGSDYWRTKYLNRWMNVADDTDDRGTGVMENPAAAAVDPLKEEMETMSLDEIFGRESASADGQ